MVMCYNTTVDKIADGLKREREHIMKKALVLLALTMALILCFAACGGEESEHTHEYGEWITTKNATCTADGTQTRYCSCGEKQTEVIVALGHTPGETVVEDKIPPTMPTEATNR